MTFLIIAAVLLTTCHLPEVLTYHEGLNQAAQRRQHISYSTSIRHEDPKHPDQVAQSSINVNFNPKNIESRQPRNPIYFQNPPQKSYSRPHPTAQYNDHDTQTQLFNVGYSVSFKQPQQQVRKHVQAFKPKPNLDDGEIITGTTKHNEKVDAPNLSRQSYELEEKAHKLSGIKPRTRLTQSFGSVGNAKQIISKANLSPTTQKYFKDLEKTKVAGPTTEQARENVQKNYSWRNLSPTVEIVRSSEIPVGNKITTSTKFNHAGALGRSELFDQTNALENNNIYAASNQQSLLNSLEETELNDLPPITNHLGDYSGGNSVQELTTQVTPTDDFSQQFLRPAFPVDLRLVRDPFLTTDPQNIPQKPNVLPIHFDIRPIQQAMSNIHIPQVPQQNFLFTPNMQQFKQAIPHQEPVQEPVFHAFQNPPQFNYKIYGKPQPIKPPHKHGYSTKIFNERFPSQRQPRGNPEDILQTELRPPPLVNSRFQRRVSGHTAFIVY